MIIELLAANIIYFQKPQIEMRPAAVELALTTPVEPDLTTKEGIVTFAHQKVIETWGEGEWESFRLLVEKESGFDPLVKNPKSTAFGIGQFVDKTQRAYGIEGVADPKLQIGATIKYIQDRYGTPSVAWTYHKKHNFY